MRPRFGLIAATTPCDRWLFNPSPSSSGSFCFARFLQNEVLTIAEIDLCFGLDNAGTPFPSQKTFNVSLEEFSD